jgi:hypothetical protein
MTAAASPCPRCQGAMQEGFIIDENYGSRSAAAWHAGPPRKSVWVGLKIDRNDTLPIRTFRCTACGYLESYAVRTEAG